MGRVKRMQFKYCPQCGSMDFASSANGPTCRNCLYHGPLPEGSMEKINEIKKRAPRTTAAPAHASSENASQSMKELAEKLKAMKGKSTSDVEFL